MNYFTDEEVKYMKDSMFWGGFAAGIIFTIVASVFLVLIFDL